MLVRVTVFFKKIGQIFALPNVLIVLKNLTVYITFLFDNFRATTRWLCVVACNLARPS